MGLRVPLLGFHSARIISLKGPTSKMRSPTENFDIFMICIIILVIFVSLVFSIYRDLTLEPKVIFPTWLMKDNTR